MAEFNADILLKVLSGPAEREIAKLESKINRLAVAAQNIGKANTFSNLRTAAERAAGPVSTLTKGLQRLDRLGRVGVAAGATAGLNALGKALAEAGLSFDFLGQHVQASLPGINQFGAALKGLTGFIEPAVHAISSIGPATAVAIAGVTALGVAFPDAFAAIAKSTEPVKQGFKALLANLNRFEQSVEPTARFKRLIDSVRPSINQLEQGLAAANYELKNYSLYTEEAVEAAESLVRVQSKLAAEQAQLNKLTNAARSKQLGEALQRTGLGGAFDKGPKLLPAFQERGLQELNTGYAEALRLTQQRTAELTTAANVERALTEETTRGVRFREKSADVAQRLRDYNGRILTTTQGTNQAMSRSAQVANSWQTALAQGSRWLKLSKAESDKLLTSNRQTLSVYNAQIEAQKQLAALDKRRVKSQKQQQQRAEANGKRLESIALGVGFPLLFGAGPASILGSLAGSFAGSGFGGQILGGAIGQLVDDFVQSTTDLGKALGRPTEAFNYLKNASLTSSRELEKFVEQLESVGSGAQASAAAQQDFARSIGRENAQNLIAFGEAADRGSRAWAQAVARMQGRIAGVAVGPTNFLARGGEISNLRTTIRGLSDSLERAGKGDAARTLRDRTNPFASFGQSQEEVIQNYRDAIQEAESALPPLKIKLDPRQVREELINTLTKQLETIDLGKNLIQQVRDRARAQEDLDQQRADAILQQERAIADLRLSVEQRVQDLRLANLKRENELLTIQAQIRERSLANQNFALRNRFTDDRTSQVANAVADYLEAELKAANDSAKIRRDAALEVQRLEIETERFKLQVAKQVARLNEENAKRIADINKGVRRQNQDQDTRRFDIEKRIARIRLLQSSLDFSALAQQAKQSGSTTLESLANASAKIARDSIIDLGKLEAPPALKELAAIAPAGVSTAGIDTANARAVTLLKSLKDARLTLVELARQGNYQQLEATLGNILIDPLIKAREEAFGVWDAINGQNRTTPAADRSASLTRTLGQLKELRDLIKDPNVQKALDVVIGRLPADTKATEDAVIATDLLRTLNDEFYSLTDQLEAASQPLGKLTRYQQIYNELTRQGIALDSDYAVTLLDRAKAVDQLSFKLQEALVYSKALDSVFSGIGDALAESITFGVESIIDGTKTAQEVFADFLNTVARMLMQTAAQMIAQYIAIGIARAFAGVPAGAGAGASTPDPVAQLNASALAYRAKGGPVTSGSPYIVGEKGPELFVPGRSGTIVPNDQMGGSVNSVVNVTINGDGTSNVDSSQGAELGRLINSSVTAILMRERRPGGMLAR